MKRILEDRKWILLLLAAVFAVHLYFVQELLAITLLAAVVCCVFGVFVGTFLLLHRFASFVMQRAEVRMQTAAQRAAHDPS